MQVFWSLVLAYSHPEWKKFGVSFDKTFLVFGFWIAIWLSAGLGVKKGIFGGGGPGKVQKTKVFNWGI